MLVVSAIQMYMLQNVYSPIGKIAYLLHHIADGDPDAFLAFLLDPSVQAPVLTLAGQLGSFVVDELCHLTRTWLYQHHWAWQRALGFWKYLV